MPSARISAAIAAPSSLSFGARRKRLSPAIASDDAVLPWLITMMLCAFAYANAHNIILISQGSTASSIAVAGDNLFRLAPNDKLEGAAMAALMRADGIDMMFGVYRLDTGNFGLFDSTQKAFVRDGGTFAAGTSYLPSTSDFTSVVQF